MGSRNGFFGMSTYDFASESQVVCAFTHKGIWQLVNINVSARSLKMIELPFTYLTQIRAFDSRAVFEAASPSMAPCIVELDLQAYQWNILRQSTDEKIDEKYISEPQSISFETKGGSLTHGFYYPPKNNDFNAPENELPPLIVICHGGPTAASNNGLRLKTQFWTSRGFAVFDVNYRGSTGFGARLPGIIRR